MARVVLPPAWWAPYLGKPWAALPEPPASYNCGELVRAVHRDLAGIDSPAIPVTDAQSRLQCAKAMRPEYFGLEPLPEGVRPQSLDVAFLGRRAYLGHCGVVVDTPDGLRVLHCPEAACGVSLESLAELRMAGFPVARFFRHRDLERALAARGFVHA